MISVQVVTWNSGEVLDRCLRSLAEQTWRDFEVVIVDNASEDGSADRAERHLRSGLPGRLVRLDRNTGFCAAHNRAFAVSNGEWVLFMNPDAHLPPGFLGDMAAVTRRVAADVGSIAPCILLPDGTIDSVGLVLDRLRRVYDRGRGQSLGARHLEEREILGGTGAVVLHRRSMLEAVSGEDGPLDELLFAYYDDLDLALEARLHGWRCLYVPELRAYHDRAGSNAIRGLRGRVSRGPAQALTIRNRILVMAKHERWGALLPSLPYLVAFEVARIAFLAIRSPRALVGYAAAIRDLPLALRQRRRLRALQGSRLPPVGGRVEGSLSGTGRRWPWPRGPEGGEEPG